MAEDAGAGGAEAKSDYHRMIEPMDRNSTHAIWVALALAFLVNAGCDKRKDAPANLSTDAAEHDPHARQVAASDRGAQPSGKIDAEFREVDATSLVANGGFSERSKNTIIDLLSSNIAAGRFRESWEFVRSIPAADAQKTNFYYYLLSRMAGCGEADLAFTILDETFGSGKIRTSLLGAIFSSPVYSLADLKKERGKLEYPDERAVIDRVLGNRLIYEVRLDPGAFGKSPAFDAEEITALAKGLGQRLTRQTNTGKLPPESALQEGLQFVDGLVASNAASADLLRKYLEFAANSRPFEAWKELETRGGSMDPAVSEGIGISIARQMVARDPRRGMELLVGRPEWSATLTGGIEAWLEADSRAAGDWVNASSSRLSSEQADAIAFGNVRYALANHEFESARNWLGQIAGAKTREQAESAMKAAVPDM